MDSLEIGFVIVAFICLTYLFFSERREKNKVQDLLMVASILEVIREDELYALDIEKRLPEKFQNCGNAHLYVVLMRMVAQGSLSDREETDEEKTGPRRRLYKKIKGGRKVEESTSGLTTETLTPA